MIKKENIDLNGETYILKEELEDRGKNNTRCNQRSNRDKKKLSEINITIMIKKSE